MDLEQMSAQQLDEELRRLASELDEHARECCGPVGDLLRRVEIRHVEARGRDWLRAEIPELMMDRLRDLCGTLAGIDIDGFDIEHDERVLGLLALAVVRGGRVTAPPAQRK